MKVLITRGDRGGRITVQALGMSLMVGALFFSSAAQAGEKIYRFGVPQTKGNLRSGDSHPFQNGKTLSGNGSSQYQGSDTGNLNSTQTDHGNGRQLQNYTVAFYDGDCYDFMVGTNLFKPYSSNTAYAFRPEQIEKLCELPSHDSYLTSYVGPYSCVYELFRSQYSLSGINYDVVQPEAYLMNGVPVDILTDGLPLTMADLTFACSQAADDEYNDNERASCIYSQLVDLNHTLSYAIDYCLQSYDGVSFITFAPTSRPTVPTWAATRRPTTSGTSTTSHLGAVRLLGIAALLGGLGALD